MPFFDTPSPPQVIAPPGPTQEEIDAAVAKQNDQKQLSLTRYLTRASQLGASELSGNVTSSLKTTNTGLKT